ncbi:unnamed protein product [Pocillopora meandrina]|uniref:Uncharacterized protein n=1 Tax=Pocillopora meandrina TaxID=46732 RepID=A0AAU9VU40_9CNID|nr:unnamed protein product [Pocillopora meandrina]
MALWIYLIVPYNIESDIKRCLMVYKKIMGTCPAYINELLELNKQPAQQKYTRYIREKEEGRTFSATTSRCWNHLPLKLRASQSVNTLKNALYKHFKLSQLRDNIFTPFLDILFLDRMI